MSVKNLIQHDFLAGEITPRMEMRDDTEGRKHGLDSLINFFIHLQGTVESAYGFQHIADIAGNYGRTIDFPVNLFTGYQIIITDVGITIVDNAGIVQKNSLFLNGDFWDGDDNWTTIEVGSATAVFFGGVAVLSGGATSSQIITLRQEASVVVGNSNKVRIQTAIGEGDMIVRIGSGAGLIDLYNEVHSTSTLIELTDLVSTTSSLWIDCVVAGPKNTKMLNDIQCFDTTVGETNWTFPSPWSSNSDIRLMQSEMSPSEIALYFCTPNTAPQRLVYTKSTREWSFGGIVFTNAPASWIPGNYPAALTFFEGRMWLASLESDPATFWGSKSQDHFVFTTGVGADDALEQTLDKRGKIQWIAGGKSLVIGTETAEHIITSEERPIKPGDIEATEQSTNGSAPIKSLKIGTDLFYVSPDGRKIRSLGYAWAEDAWKTKDLTYASQHITKDNSINQLVWSSNPHSLIMAVTEKGELLSCTYEPLSRTAGFARRTTQGVFLSISSLSFGGTDEVWALVDRSEGQGTLSIERRRITKNIKLDSYQRISTQDDESTFFAPHLAGKVCQATVNGAVVADVTPAPITGEFEVDFAGSIVNIGLGYVAYLKTLPIADEIDKVGTTRTMQKRWVKIFARIINSWRPLIQGTTPADRHVATLMDTVEPPQSESVEVSDVGYSFEAQIEISQDIPLPVEISGIFGKLEQNQV